MSNIKPVIANVPVVENRALAPETFLLTLKAPGVVEGAQAGHFVKIRAWDTNNQSCGPFLDRPFSIHHIDGDYLSLLYRVVGTGTRIISRLSAGDQVRISGPLGSSLSDVLPQHPEKIYLVGGGIGLAPMRLAMNWFGGPANATLFYGERSGALQVSENWLNSWAGKNYKAVTEDGRGYGDAALVTKPLAEALELEPRPIFACGPQGMLAAVSALAVRMGVTPWVSVEAGMACGFGVCLTCSLPLVDGGRFRACHEGPVIDGSLVDWNGK